MPIGPFSDWEDCMAHMEERYDEETAKNVCGAMKRDLGGSEKLKNASPEQIKELVESKKVMSYEDNGRLFMNIFLLDGSVNMNSWGVTPDSIPRNIQTAIGKPLVLYKNGTGEFDHPPTAEQFAASGGDINHALSFQDLYRIGTFIDVYQSKTKPGQWYGVAEITDENTKKAIREDPKIPLYVSPQIRLLHPLQPDNAITEWQFLHSAIVSQPAFGVQKAYINGQCSGDKPTCLLQLKRASVSKNGGKYGCGFCTYKAIKQIQSEVLSRTAAAVQFESMGQCVSMMQTKEMGSFSSEQAREMCRKMMDSDSHSMMNPRTRDMMKMMTGSTKSFSSQAPTEQHIHLENSIMSNTNDNTAASGTTRLQQVETSTVQETAKSPTSNDSNSIERTNTVSTRRRVVSSDGSNNNNETNPDNNQEPREGEEQEEQDQGGAGGGEATSKKARSLRELSAKIEALATQKKTLEIELENERNAKAAMKTLLEKQNEEIGKYNDRIANLEKKDQEREYAAKLSQLTNLVYNSPVYKELSKEAKDKQVETWANSGLSVEKINEIVEPMNASIKKASLSKGGIYQSRVNLGGAERMQVNGATEYQQKQQQQQQQPELQTKQASVEKKNNNNIDDDDLGAFSLVTQMFPGRA